MSRPWDGLVTDEDIRALESRGKPVDRAPQFGSRPALIVVDMTRTFTDPGYAASCFDTGGEAATVATKRVLDAARQAGIPVFFTKVVQTTPGEFLPVELGFKLVEKGELLATPEGLPPGNEIGDLLAPVHGEVVISKPKPSAFYGTALETYLNYFHVDSLIVTGMVTSGCVRATVIDGYMRNLHVVVVEDAVADYSDFNHRASLLDMHVKYADSATTDQVADHLLQRAGAVPEPV
jgi:nicotinamidase-related amidase